MKTMKNTFCAISVSILLLFTQIGHSVVDPSIEWETLSTPHFELIFDARHYQTARKYALRLELNYKLLNTYFSESPRKTIVILNDSTDLANGYAANIPYPHIMAYPVLPTANESISDYADWPQELTLHEYTHILNFEPTHGVMQILRKTMGPIISPTMLLPRWWHEGIAVEMETRFSSHGRLRSVYQDATLRALVNDQQLHNYSIADINESELDSWPRGSRPYLFGSLLLSEIQTHKGGTIGNTLLQRFSNRFPYFLNTPAEEEVGKNFEGLLNDSLASIDGKAMSQLEKIRQTTPTKFNPIETKYLESYNPRLSPNGRFLTFIAKNKWGKSSIQIFDRHEENRPFDLEKDSFSQFLSIDNKAPENKDAPPSGNIYRVSWLPDSSGFVFDQVRPITMYATYSDLHFFDLNKKKTNRITSGQRLREPGLSPDGKLLAAVQLEQSNTRLVTLNFDGSNLQVLYSPADFHKVANPSFLDAATILFTERDNQGNTSLKKLTLENKKIETLSFGSITQPESLNLTPQGIVFVARENGMQNVYLTEDQFKNYQRLTNVETAAFDGAVDARQGFLYSTIMTSTGLKVVTSDFKKEMYPKPPPSIEPLLKDRYSTPPAQALKEEQLEQEFGAQLSDKKTYSSSDYLMPTYWLPFAYFTASGYGTQVSTSTFDPLEKHAYSAQAGYDSFVNEASLSLNYTNSATRWPFTVSLAAQERNQPGIKFQYHARQFNYLAIHDLRPFSENITVGVGASGMETTTTVTKKRLGPQFVLLYDGTAKSAFSEVPFAGWRLSLFGNHFFKTDQLDNLTRGIASATYFYSSQLPDRQIAVIHFKAQQMHGDSTTADLTPSQNFQLAQDFSSPNFVLRGYDLGYFYFSNARSATIEYHIPFATSRGWDTLPAFMKRSKISFFAEGMAIEGFATNYETLKYVRQSLNKIYTSYGVELKGDFTLGYYFPVTGLFGIYHRPDYSGPGKTSGFIGIQL